MYDMHYKDNTKPRDVMPIINVIVDLEKDEFKCSYSVEGSINVLSTPPCGSTLNDEHFDNIVCRFETQAKVLERFTS
jgi:hypothetical protein